VRFRVENEEWHDQSLLAPPAKADTTSEMEKKVPYSIVVSTPIARGSSLHPLESCLGVIQDQGEIDADTCTVENRRRCSILVWEMCFGGE
jgi:hypothetical protein